MWDIPVSYLDKVLLESYDIRSVNVTKFNETILIKSDKRDIFLVYTIINTYLWMALERKNKIEIIFLKEGLDKKKTLTENALDTEILSNLIKKKKKINIVIKYSGNVFSDFIQISNIKTTNHVINLK